MQHYSYGRQSTVGAYITYICELALNLVGVNSNFVSVLIDNDGKICIKLVEIVVHC